MKVVFIHGFSAKEEDNEYFLEFLCKKHIKTEVIHLPGHENEKIKKMTCEKWINGVEEEFKNIVENERKVILIGHSMGGAIAAILASKYKEVSKLVLLSPAFEVGNIKQNKDDMINIIFRKANKKHELGFEGAIKKFFKIPPSDYKEVKKVGRKARETIGNISCETLILHGTLDQLVPITSSFNVLEEMHAKKHLTLLLNVRHQMFKGYKKKEITQYIYYFLKGGIIWKLKRKNQI